MKRMPAGVSKARCHAVIKLVQTTGEPVVVTKRATPVVKVVPAEAENSDIFGFMAGRVKIVGDIESPIPEWEVTKRWSLLRPLYVVEFRIAGSLVPVWRNGVEVACLDGDHDNIVR